MLPSLLTTTSKSKVPALKPLLTPQQSSTHGRAMKELDRVFGKNHAYRAAKPQIAADLKRRIASIAGHYKHAQAVINLRVTSRLQQTSMPR